jgi:tetratricopeptide (TPR) repeat protein
LTGEHLLEETGHDRYRFHDLLRLYAAERAATEETDHERHNAARRLLTWYLHTADAAGRVLTPQWRYVPLDSPEAGFLPLAFTTHHQALEWCEAERANLVAATRHAAECGQHVIAWKLPAVLWNFFTLRGHWTDWITTHETGLAAARYLHDRHGEAWIANNLGAGYQGIGRFEEAFDHLQQALVAWRELDDHWGEGWTLHSLASTYQRMGQCEEALDHYHQALIVYRKLNDRWGEGRTLYNVGEVLHDTGRLGAARTSWHQALAIFEDLGDPWAAEVRARLATLHAEDVDQD